MTTTTLEVATSPEVAAILAALATVEGLTPTASVPDVATAGAAWARWTQTLYTGGSCPPGPCPRSR